MGKVRQAPPAFPVISGTGQSIRAAVPVRGQGQWREMALAQNWLLGRGNTVATSGPVMDVAGGYEIAPGSNSLVAHVVDDNAGTATGFLWLVGLKLDESTPSARGTFRDFSDNVIGSWSIGAETWPGQVRCFRIEHQDGDIQTVGSDRFLSIAVNNDADSAGNVYIASCKAIELPRSYMTAITDERTLQSGEPIYDDADSDTVKSLWGTQKYFIDALSASRRACLLSWRGPNGDPFVSFDAAFDVSTNSPISSNSVTPILPRCLRGETTVALEWRASVKGVGGAGELRLQTGGVVVGVTDTVTTTIASGGPTMLSGTILARTEDIDHLDDHNGWRSNDPEYCLITMRKTTGTSVEIYGFWLREQR